jgi:hypothetical protein
VESQIRTFFGRGKIRASLGQQPATIDFVSQEFGVDIRLLADGGATTGEDDDESEEVPAGLG